MNGRAGSLAAGLAAVLAAASASGAQQLYVEVTAPVAGGAAAPRLSRDLQPALRFSFALASPRDAATGQASGKRQWKPVTIVKEWGAVSQANGQGELYCRALVVRVAITGGPAVPAEPVARGGPDNACWYQVLLPDPNAARVHVWLALPGSDFAVTGNSILVDFVEGDPDRPIVIGAVFNGRDPSGRFRLDFTRAAAAPPPIRTVTHLK